MPEQRVDGFLVAVHHVEHALGQARLRPQPGQHQRCRGILLRGLEDERVAAGDGDGEHPHRDHGREVEGRDAGDHAERLADGVDIDAGRNVFGKTALEQVRDPAGELDHLEPAGYLPRRVPGHLAVLGADQRGQLPGARGQQFPEREQHAGPPGQRRRPPAGEGLGRRGDRVVHDGRRGEVDGPGHLAGSRVVDVTVPLGGAVPRLPADPVGDVLSRHSVSSDTRAIRQPRPHRPPGPAWRPGLVSRCRMALTGRPPHPPCAARRPGCPGPPWPRPRTGSSAGPSAACARTGRPCRSAGRVPGSPPASG